MGRTGDDGDFAGETVAWGCGHYGGRGVAGRWVAAEGDGMDGGVCDLQ